MSTEHMTYLNEVVINIVNTVRTKEAIYQGSWKKRGGTGAFFVTCRKWDALESLLHKRGDYDILWGAIEQGVGDGTIRDQIRDLIGYLLLIESEITRLQIEQDGAQGTTVPGAVETPLGGVYKAPGDVLQTGKPRRIPHTVEFRSESVHKLGLHCGSVYRCFNIMDDGSMVYIRNAYNDMMWCDASQFQLNYSNEGEDE